MKLGKGWSVSADGTAWYVRPSTGRRQRGVWHVCQHCGESFPAPPTNPGLYCSKSCRGKVCGNRKATTRRSLFEEWTPEECWLAGLIWSDGYLGIDRRDYMRIVVGLTDEAPMAEAARIVGGHYRTIPKPPHKTYYRMQFAEGGAVRRIADKGMSEPKLTTRPWPDLPHPASFLRGVFDGDGCACVYKQKLIEGHPLRLTCTLLGGPLVLQGAVDFLKLHGIKPKTPAPKTVAGAVYRVNWAHYDSLRLAEVLYSEPGPRMQRKLDKFREGGAQINAGA